MPNRTQGCDHLPRPARARRAPDDAPARILIAEDGAEARLLLAALLRRWGHEVTVTADGEEAWAALQGPDPPRLAILDWEMPRLDGLEICRRLRATPALESSYVILVTGRDRTEDVVCGLEAGADDYLAKPFPPAELRARVQVGARVLRLQSELDEERELLKERVGELEEAVEHVRTLQGILAICMYCRKVRDDHDYWHQLENYMTRHSDTRFSHGICPTCFETTVQAEMAQLRESRAGG